MSHDDPDDARPAKGDEKHSPDLTNEQEDQVGERQAPAARIVHEAIRRQGIEELERPAASLIWSGLVAGVAMGTSILGEALLDLHLPAFAGKEVVTSLGYSLGFLIVIMGRLQLFTESTVTAVLPLATKPSWTSALRTGRLWLLVLLANLAGTFAFAVYAWAGGFASPELTGAIVDVARKIAETPFANVLAGGVPSGFLVATIVWLMPSSGGQRIWLIMLLTWLIALGGFAHVVVGSAEAWLLALTGTIGWGHAVFGYIVPALIGNVIGGSALFAFLAHAQVSAEISD